MKILVQGVEKAKREAELKCHACGCVFVITLGEATFIPDNRDGDYYKHRCPTKGCNRVITALESAFKVPRVSWG